MARTESRQPTPARVPLRSSSFVGLALILLAAAMAVAPQMLRGNSCGHDFDIHLVSWFDALNGWRHGIPYPHWAASANYGAGEPRFVFYPPLTWMLGAALGLILPWQSVPVALTFLLLAATGLATRALARQALDDRAATLAGCAALFSGYALFTAYERSAFGELAGGFWLPLLLLYLLRESSLPGPVLPLSVWRRALDRSAAPLALVVAGCWLSNVPLGVMACYLLAAVALAAAWLARSWAPVLRAATGAVVGTALAGTFLLPAAWQQRWVAVQQATDDPGEKIENSWLFARHSDPALALHDMELHRVSLIAVSMIAVALLGLLICWGRGKLASPSRWWVLLALIPAAILFLQLPISQPLWNLLPKLRFLQFPWRWLLALEAPMAIFFAAAVWPRESARRWMRWSVAAVCATLFLSATAFTARSFFQVCDDQDNVHAMVEVYRNGAGFEGVSEYAPPRADNSLVAASLPDACLVSDPATELGKAPDGQTGDDVVPVWTAAQGSCEATLHWQLDEPEHKRLATNIRPTAVEIPSELTARRAVVTHPRFLILRLRSYPAWRIAINGYPVASMPRREDGLIAVPVWPGTVVLTVDWTTTPDVVAGRWLSALAVLVLTGLWLWERNRPRPRLS